MYIIHACARTKQFILNNNYSTLYFYYNKERIFQNIYIQHTKYKSSVVHQLNRAPNHSQQVGFE